MELLCAEENVGNLRTRTFIFFDSCAQSETSEISTHAISEILGLLCAEQNVEISNTALSNMMGLLCAEQIAGNLKHCTFTNYGTLARRAKNVGKFETAFQKLWDSGSHNNTSENIENNALSEFQGLWFAEQNVRNLKKTHCQELWDSWITDPGSRILDPGSSFLDHGSRIQDPGSRIQDPGSRILDPGSWTQDPGSRIPDPGSWIQDPGSWLQDP